MRTESKRSLKLVKILFSLLFISGGLVSCQSSLVPPPPDALLCSHDLVDGHWICVSILDAANGVVNPKTTAVADAQTNNWIGTDVNSWENIQKWIGQLKQLAERHCN